MSPREQLVADMVVRGFSNAEIANKLFVTEKTIKYHLTNIYKELGIRGRAQLIVKFLSDGVTHAELADFKKLF